MDLLPSPEDVLALLRRTGALRDGHFAYTPEIHTDQHLETALAMRSWQNARLLSVALSRLVRGEIALRAVLPQLSIVAASASGIPIACGLAEVLHPAKVYWVERDDAAGPVRFAQFLRPCPGEKVLVVDDFIHSGRHLAEAAELLQSCDAKVEGIAVLIRQPNGTAISFGQVPVLSLASVPAPHYWKAADCPRCRRGEPVEGEAHDLLREAAACASAR
ncbi:MAG TPA: phosphoribosyltransferase family protein [Bryobacteraceae bacterium]|nr:phosphoribosyltransferase family protein [Bryobacteraceae bacterium]